MPTILRSNLVTGDTVLVGADLHVDDGLITAIDPAGSAPRPDLELPDAHILPGFVDQHCHGGGEADVSTDSAAQAAAFHLGHGTTTMVASLVTAAADVLLAQVARLRELVEAE